MRKCSSCIPKIIAEDAISVAKVLRFFSRSSSFDSLVNNASCILRDAGISTKWRGLLYEIT